MVLAVGVYCGHFPLLVAWRYDNTLSGMKQHTTARSHRKERQEE
jgi:hypothetical protein